jgi:hypothetical protein
MGLIDAFLDCFAEIEFTICKGRTKHQLSIETIATGEREIIRMLNEAKRNLSKIKKLHMKGKASSEELMDWEWRVHELEEELEKFNESQRLDDLDDETLL